MRLRLKRPLLYDHQNTVMGPKDGASALSEPLGEKITWCHPLSIHMSRSNKTCRNLRFLIWNNPRDGDGCENVKGFLVVRVYRKYIANHGGKWIRRSQNLCRSCSICSPKGSST